MDKSYLGERHRETTWGFIWRSEDIRRKILITLGLIILYRVLLNIPIPGIITTPESVRNNITPGSGLYTMVEFISMLSGSSLLNISVLALGLLPFNLASLLLQLFIPLIPGLQRRLEENPYEARRWFEKWNYYLAVPVAVFESFLFLFLISPNCEGRFLLLEGGTAQTGVFFTITTVLLLVAGSFIAVWISGLISEFGIRGQGNAILITSGIIGQFSGEFVRLLKTQVEGVATIEGLGLVQQLPQRVGVLLDSPGVTQRLFMYGVLFVLCIIVVVYLQSGRRNVPIIYPSRSMLYYRMQNPAKRANSYLPLMLTIGTDGLIGSQLLVMLTTFYAPLITCTNIPRVNAAANWLINVFSENSVFFGPIAFLSVVSFTFIYAGIKFEQMNYGDHFRKSGARIPGVHSGAPTQNYLSRINRRITLVPAVMLGLLAIAPWVFSMAFGVRLSLLEGEKILIIVGVIRDAYMNIEAEMKLYGYQDRLLIN